MPMASAMRDSGELHIERRELARTAQQRNDVIAEKQADGEQRPEVDCDVERQALVTPPRCCRDEHEVSRARDRQKLGQPLNDCKNDDL